MVDVTAFFAGLMGILLVALSVNVIVDRYRYRIPLGDGGHADTNRKIRAHANFVEYVPLILLLMGYAEMQGASKVFLQGIGWLLLAGRVSHAYSLLVFELKPGGRIIFRQFGMGATFSVLLLVACSVLV